MKEINGKQFKELTDFLPEGSHVLRVYPKQEWDSEKNEFIEGSHRHGAKIVRGKPFKWWMYQTPIDKGDKKEYVTLLANQDNKAFFDTGKVIAVIKKRFDPNTGEPHLVTYFNEYREKTETPEPKPTKKSVGADVEESDMPWDTEEDLPDNPELP
jgi:hypothetical protein